jgi:F-type H+-transporting ATPase subunit epsilon
MKLVVATPDRVVLEADAVASLRAEDATGSFGVLPGHADLLTVLVPSVIAWRDGGGAEHYVAVRGGVLTVRDGTTVEVASREAVAGDDVEAIGAELAAAAEAAREREASARTDAIGLEAAVVRRIQDYLQAGGGTAPPLGEA